MILYRFLSAEYGIKSIKDRRLKISTLKELNDPFEFLSVDLSDKEFRKALKKTKQYIAEKSGVICFSKTWENPLLWSHYADKHKGICLGFKVLNQSLIAKIEYVTSRLERPAFDPPLDRVDQEFWKKFMNKIIHTKFAHWQYEEEYRLWVALEEKINGFYYIKFNDTVLALTKVIVGCESKVTRFCVSDALSNLEDSVEIFKSRAAFKSFKVVRNKNEKLWK